MQRIIVVMSLILCVFISVANASEKDWNNDLDLALKKAQKSKKAVLVDFTGSDWCTWCIRLHEEVFAKPEFNKWAKNNLELVVLDFPQNKPQNEDLKKKNHELAEIYGVRGFPTVLILDSNGKLIGRTGYLAGGVKSYIKHLQTIISTK